MSTSSPVAVEVPDIGDFSDVPIIEILVSEGDSVSVDDPLVTLESDKATMDVPAPFAGTVTEVIAQLGDKVSEGSPIVRIEPSEDAPTGSKAAAATSDGAVTESDAPDAVASAADAEAQEPAVSEPGQGASSPGVASGDGASGGDAGEGAAPAAEEAPPEAARDGGGPVYASPSVRRLARERSVDLSRVSGSGRKGRITKDDVERAASGEGAAAGTADGAGAPAAGAGAASGGGGLELLPWPQIDFTKFGEIERVQRSRIQRISAPNLARNWVMIPHVTHNDEADITELEAWRKQLNTEFANDGVKFTMLAFLVAACVATLKEFPIFNSSLDGEELVLKHYYNIGFAADTPNGLVVPVIKGADTMGIVDVAKAMAELSSKARAGKLGPGDMQGASFTISSLGGIGGTSFTPIINAPEVAILGVTRSAMKPVWTGGEFVPRLMLPLSLSYDHRVIDGAAAARFVVFLTRVLSDFRRVML